MFDSICFRCKSDNVLENYLDLGTLAEALLFYKKVILVIRWNSAEKLISGCGPEPLWELIRSDLLSVVYEQNMSGIQTVQIGGREAHRPIIVEGVNTIQHSPQHIFPQLFAQAIGRQGKGRRLANKFLQDLDIHRHEPERIRPVVDDWNNAEYVNAVILKLLEYYAPEYPQDQPVKFEIQVQNNDYYVDTNINFALANNSYHKRVPPSHSSLTEASLLTNFITIQENLNFAARYSSEIVTNPTNAALLQLRMTEAARHSVANMKTVGEFQEANFDDCKALGDIINSGDRSFSDLMKLLSKADKFRSWLHKQDSDVDLLKEYIQEVSHIDWLDQAPSKTMRWAFFTGAGTLVDVLGAGGIGTVAGVGLSVFDAFILEKLLHGWRPNQFLHGPYKKFIKK